MHIVKMLQAMLQAKTIRGFFASLVIVFARVSMESSGQTYQVSAAQKDKVTFICAERGMPLARAAAAGSGVLACSSYEIVVGRRRRP
jgi:hypothetical protein